MSDTPVDNSSFPWITMILTYEDMPLALRVRTTVDTPENRTGYPHLATVTHQLAKVKSNGLPENKYNRSLAQFDLDLQAAVSRANEAIVFLVETFSGERIYYACVADMSSLQERIEPLRASYPQHTITVAVREYHAWKFYNGYRQQFPW